MELNTLYRPITSTPFRHSVSYAEFEPCAALKPYIRCFWGTTVPTLQSPESTLVIPDTCMDIIFRANHTDNTVSGGFCGIDDRTFISNSDSGKMEFTFGIRFYPWGAAPFSEDKLKNTKNSFFSAEEHFSKLTRKIKPLVFDAVNVEKLIPVVEKVLLDSFNAKHQNSAITEVVGSIIEKRGNLHIGSLSSDIYISERQLERIFAEYIGCSVKCLAALIRYQFLWNEILYNPTFKIMDAVTKYGYFDQSHLLNDFRKYHSMNINQAKSHALSKL